MKRFFILGLFLGVFFLAGFFNVFSQETKKVSLKSQNPSKNKKVTSPLIKSLPDWKDKKDEAKLVTNSKELKEILGERPMIDVIEFFAGAKGVIANYDAGKLLIIEYGTPQASSYVDKKIKSYLSENTEDEVSYRRIGNYNVFVFDRTSENEANALLDKVKYEKVVQWLGQNPHAFEQAERNFIVGTMTLFISTVLAIVAGFAFAVIIGIISGIIFYRMRAKKREQMPAYSDGGGLTRLNLDGLTSEISANRLLKD